jgi:hypothetical protein
MKFARFVFIGAGIWGILLLTALYIAAGTIERQHVSLLADPQFFYGFMAVTMAWQFAFLVIGSDPARYRPLMLPSMVEKFFYLMTIAVLYLQGRITAADALANTPDLVLGVLFVIAFAKTASPWVPSVASARAAVKPFR